jgi:hypothetical protein
MASYLALTAHVEDDALTTRVLSRVFASDYFTPAALAGVEGHASGDHFFLAGYALEQFLAVMVTPDTPSPASVEIPGVIEPAQAEYLRQVVQSVRIRDAGPRRLSPFEELLPELAATRLTCPPLPTSVSEALLEWLKQHPAARCSVYGSIRVAVRAGFETRPLSLFRASNSPEQTETSLVPLLTLRMGRSPLGAGSSDVALQTSASIWLEQGSGMRGHVGSEEARVNLQELSHFAAQLIGDYGGRASVEMLLEGSSFERERERITDSLGSLPGLRGDR